MKRMMTILVALSLCATLGAQQGNITTRKRLFSDFTDKITKVVMTGGEILDGALRQEVVDGWTASPFEFCTADEYETLKKSDKYYFLLVAAGRAKGEEAPMVRFLTLEKGGADSGDNIPLRTEVISLPLCPVEGSDGRELVFLPALVKGVQDFALQAMESEKVAYTGSAWFNERFDKKVRIKRICLAEEDLSDKVSDKDRARFLDEDILVMEADEADEVYTAKTFNTLVSYTVSAGIWSYKMLIEADTDDLYYIRKHKVTDRTGEGFTPDDLKKIARSR